MEAKTPNLSKALSLSFKLLDKAKEGEWSTVQEINDEMLGFLKAWEAEEKADANKEDAASVLTQIKNNTDEAVTLGNEERKGLGKNIIDFRHRKSAAKAYKDNT
ncbi:MAG: flagellar protein FliT [Sedimenticola sp.]